MTARPIGYYVHHHGAGHISRARLIAAAYDQPIVLLGTGLGVAGLELADDRPQSGRFDGVDETSSRPHALHYAPLDHGGIRSRVSQITNWIAAEKPVLMIVDVSVEVAMLARLASVPTIYVRLNGDRGDDAHLDAFRGAHRLLAPFHEDMEPRSTPRWVREKTRYLPGIANRHDPAPDENSGCILVVIGRGGPSGDGEELAQAARACPEKIWRVIGPCTIPHNPPPNLDLAGWVSDPEREISRASVIIGAAGDGLVGAVLAADRPFICIPQARPYDEQHSTARRLGELGAALILRDWPQPGRWPRLIMKAMSLPAEPRRRLHDAEGVRKAAGWIAETAISIDPSLDQLS